MPLLPSASKEAFSHNVAEMIRAGRPRNQALAASYANQRKNRNVGGPNVPMQGQPRPPMPQFSQPMPQGTPMAQPPQFRNGYDMGGIPTMSEMAPWYTRAEDRGLDQFHGGGLFGGSAPGRADTLPRDVPVNSHVIPADVVSAIGQGNTLAGGNTLTGMFHSLPWGIQGGGSRGTSALHPPAPPRPMQPSRAAAVKPTTGVRLFRLPLHPVNFWCTPLVYT